MISAILEVLGGAPRLRCSGRGGPLARQCCRRLRSLLARYDGASMSIANATWFRIGVVEWARGSCAPPIDAPTPARVAHHGAVG